MVKCFWAEPEPEYLVSVLEVTLFEHPSQRLQQQRIGLYHKRKSRLSLLLLSVRFIVNLFTTLHIVWLH